MPADNPTPEQITEAIRLLNEHEDSKERCRAFLRSVNEPAADPISLKLWLADSQMKLARAPQN